MRPTVRTAGAKLAVVLAFGVATQTGQARAQPPTLRLPPKASEPAPAAADATVVSVSVAVHDKKGAPISGLTRDSLELQVDGKPETIRALDPAKDLPLTLGLLVDASMGQRDALEDERKAGKAFFDEMLKGAADRNKAFIVQFARQTDLLQDVTASTQKISAAIQQLDTVAGSKGGTKDSTSGVDAGDGRSSGVRGGTTLYDAVFLSCDEVIARQKSRRALIILSDGNDRGSKESVTSAIEAAQRAGTAIYAIYFKGRQDNTGRFQRNGGVDDGGYPGGGYPGGGYPGGGYPGGGYPGGGYPGGGYPGGYPGGGGPMPRNEPKTPDGKKILEHIAHETGGQFFDLSRKENLPAVFSQIEEELRSQYRLEFAPGKAASAEGFHTIGLALARSDPKDHVVQVQAGFYSSD